MGVDAEVVQLAPRLGCRLDLPSPRHRLLIRAHGGVLFSDGVCAEEEVCIDNVC